MKPSLQRKIFTGSGLEFLLVLSFDSKYTALFLIIGLIGFLLIAKPYRKFLFSGWFLLYLICFAITILPVVIWNVRNDFASFKFQSEGRVQEGIAYRHQRICGCSWTSICYSSSDAVFFTGIFYLSLSAKNMDFDLPGSLQTSYFY